jgi:hypothetical protein
VVAGEIADEIAVDTGMTPERVMRDDDEWAVAALLPADLDAVRAALAMLPRRLHVCHGQRLFQFE